MRLIARIQRDSSFWLLKVHNGHIVQGVKLLRTELVDALLGMCALISFEQVLGGNGFWLLKINCCGPAIQGVRLPKTVSVDELLAEVSGECAPMPQNHSGDG